MKYRIRFVDLLISPVKQDDPIVAPDDEPRHVGRRNPGKERMYCKRSAVGTTHFELSILNVEQGMMKLKIEDPIFNKE